MSNKEDGGLAFPFFDERVMNSPEWGITMRDYFAAKAMQGMFSNDALLARYHNDGLANMISPEVLAVTAAYSMADAMLRERAK